MSTHYLFLDESGDHSLEKIDPQYPVFVLGGALIRTEDYKTVEEHWRRTKRDLFGSDAIILHTADITRNKNGFERMVEPAFRERIYSGLNLAMEKTPCTALGCVIRKEEHLRRYGLAAIDPYHLSLNILVERAFFAMGKKGKLHIIAESRHSGLDRTLEIVFLQLKVQGTQFITPSEINRIGMDLHIREKSKNITGLQIADLLVSPMGRFVLGKTTHTDWEVIQRKLYRYRGRWEGAGLVILPK